jgi:hypothetical protein
LGWESAEFCFTAIRQTELRNIVQKIHSCAITKVATAKCKAGTPQSTELKKGTVVTTKGDTPWTDYTAHPNEVVWGVCPPYWLPNNPTSEQESAAIAAAEEECTGEIDPQQKSLHDQIVQYRQDHGRKEDATPIDYDSLAKKYGGSSAKLTGKECAAKVRTFYPGAYNDIG